jgi:type II secretory pathway component GspD/PulD (secretin)
MRSPVQPTMLAASLRQALAIALTGLLCCAPIVPREARQVAALSRQNEGDQSQGQAPPVGPNDSALQTVKPNAKSAKKYAELGDKATADGHFDEALNDYEQAVRYAPQDQTLIERAAQLRSKLVRDHVSAAERDALAGHADVAAEELAKALLIDPDNAVVAERMREMKAMNDGPAATKGEGKIEGLPELKPRAGKQNLNLRGDTKTVYEQLGQLFGVKLTFDPDLATRNVQLRLDDVDFDTAMKVLMVETKTFYVPLTSGLAFVAQDSVDKRRQYAPVAERTFPLPASVGNDEMTELLRLLREMTGGTHMQLDSASRMITVRDTPERLALIGELIRQEEKARSEILLEIEILEVDRNKARDLGILPPSSAQLISLSPTIITQLRAAQDIGTLVTLLASIFGSSTGANASSSLNPSSLIPPLTVVGGGKSTFLLTLPAVAAQFSDALSLVKSGQQVLLRAQDGKPASFFVGDRYPITLSLLSGSLGATSFVPGTTNSILPSATYNVGNGPIALTADDFRNLGLLDLAVVNEIDNTLTILQNQGQGTFLQAGNPISLGTARSNAPAIAPAIASSTFTSSGFHDLLVTDPDSNTVTVLLSNGDDTFKQAANSPIKVGQGPSALVTGDFNGDGNQDFIVTNFTDSTISEFFGNGDGTFTQATGSPFGLPSTSTGPIAMAEADFNADGIQDLAIVNRTTNNVTILLGNANASNAGNGTFALAPGSPFPVGQFPVAIASGDLNNDGKQDIAVLNQTDNTVSPLLGNGDGTFALAPNAPLATGQSPTALTIADFNADGNQDIAVTDPQTSSVAVFLNQGLGVFASGFELPVGTNPSAILSASLSGASLPDVAITDDPSGAAGQVTVILSPAALFANSGAGAGVAQQPYPGSEYEDIGLKVKATPTLHANDEVTLQLDFEIRALSGSNINGIPILTNRTLSQIVRVKAETPTIISGLLDNEETKTITGLPGLATLPTVGYAFGQRNTTAQDTELLIMVTPRKLRLRDRISRTIYAGHDTTGRGSIELAPVPPPREPPPRQPQ